MAETMFKTAQELLDQRRKNTQDNLLTIKAIEGKQRERPLSGYAKFGGMLGEAAGERLKDYLGVKSEDDYLRDYESGIEQRGVMEQNLGAEGSGYSPEVASQILSQQDRFIEESGGNLTPEIRRASDLTRDMRGLTPEQLGNPMDVASIYNKHGYTQEAINLLQQNRMTPYQQAQIQVLKDKNEIERSMWGGGTGVGGGAQAATIERNPGDIITNPETDEKLRVMEDGSLTKLEKYNAQQSVKELGTTIEPSQAEKTYDFFTSPFRALGEAMDSRERAAQAQMVSKALEKNSARARDLDAMRDLVKLPQEESGLTIPQYNKAKILVTANSK